MNLQMFLDSGALWTAVAALIVLLAITTWSRLCKHRASPLICAVQVVSYAKKIPSLIISLQLVPRVFFYLTLELLDISGMPTIWCKKGITRYDCSDFDWYWIYSRLFADTVQRFPIQGTLFELLVGSYKWSSKCRRISPGTGQRPFNVKFGK